MRVLGWRSALAAWVTAGGASLALTASATSTSPPKPTDKDVLRLCFQPRPGVTPVVRVTACNSIIADGGPPMILVGAFVGRANAYAAMSDSAHAIADYSAAVWGGTTAAISPERSQTRRGP